MGAFPTFRYSNIPYLPYIPRRKEVKMMIKMILVVVGLAMFALMASNVLAQTEQLYCFCLDAKNHTERAIERGLCDLEAEESGYKHGSIRPYVCPGPSDLECPKVCMQACSEESGETQYECIGVGSQM
jgi:hypothetical protein